MEALQEFFKRVKDDRRIGPIHISLYTALLDRWLEQSCPRVVRIRPDEMMRRSRILGRSTYYQVLKELAAYGFIEYLPEYNPERKSGVRVVPIKS